MNRRGPKWLLPIWVVLWANLLLTACSAIQQSPEEAEAAWVKSAHADVQAESFTHWDEDEPAVIPVQCAKCHSTPGYLDFHGVNGSVAGVVDHPIPVGTTIECDACHADGVQALTSTVLPSAVELVRLGSNANCYECHSGRTSGLDVEAAIGDLDVDKVDRDLSFVNIHANAAGAIMYGSEGGAGYHYSGKNYAGHYQHVVGFRDCVDCHDPHSLRMTPLQCGACHIGARSTAALPSIRTSSIVYDGDGNVREGIAEEIETLHTRLLENLQQQAQEPVNGGNLFYTEDYPYFVDAQDQPYSRWTPRLLRAAYNYQLVAKGTGSFAHNPDYVLQLLYDSIEDLGGDLRGAIRPETE